METRWQTPALRPRLPVELAPTALQRHKQGQARQRGVEAQCGKSAFATQVIFRPATQPQRWLKPFTREPVEKTHQTAFQQELVAPVLEQTPQVPPLTAAVVWPARAPPEC
jgi:hypothetical protein